MSGTRIGGIKASETNRLRHGEDFYARIGRKGGSNGHTGGFAANPELARRAGAKGGKMSHRGPSKDVSDKIKQAKEMYENGFEIKAIAKAIDRKPSTVYVYIRK